MDLTSHFDKILELTAAISRFKALLGLHSGSKWTHHYQNDKLDDFDSEGNIVQDPLVSEAAMEIESCHSSTKRDAVIEASVSLSNKQYDDITNLLGEIRLLVQPGKRRASIDGSSSATGKLINSPPPVHDPQPESSTRQGSLRCGYKGNGEEVSDCISRLYRITSRKPQSFTPEEAQSVIDDLERILVTIEMSGIPNPTSPESNSKRKRTNDQEHLGDATILGPGVKRVRRVLAAVSSIRPHSISSSRRNDCVGITSSSRYTQSYQIAYGNVIVSQCTKTTEPPLSTEDSTKDNLQQSLGKERGEVFEGRVSFVAASETFNMKLDFCFLQRVSERASHIMNPTISFHCVRPDNAEVFKVVSHGNVEVLFDMIESGLASLTDCDTKGRSLLNVSKLLMNLAMSSEVNGN